MASASSVTTSSDSRFNQVRDVPVEDARTRRINRQREQACTEAFLSLYAPYRRNVPTANCRQEHIPPDFAPHNQSTQFFSPFNGHPLTTNLQFSGVTPDGTIFPVDQPLFVTTAPTNRDQLHPILPPHWNDHIFNWLEDFFTCGPKPTTIHHSSVCINDPKNTTGIRMTFSNPPVRVGITPAISPFPGIRSLNMPCDENLHPVPDEGFVELSFPNEGGCCRPYSLWVLAEYPHHWEGTHVLVQPSHYHYPTGEHLHLQSLIESLDSKTQAKHLLMARRPTPPTAVNNLAPHVQQFIYWSIWANDGRPTGNPNYGKDAFQADPAKAEEPLAHLQQYYFSQNTPNAILLVFLKNVCPSSQPALTNYYMMDMASRILNRNFPPENTLADFICNKPLVPPCAQERICLTLQSRGQLPGDIRQAHMWHLENRRALISAFIDKYGPDALAHALLFLASDFPIAVPNRSEFPRVLNDPALSALPPIERNARINFILEQILQKPELDALYKKIQQESPHSDQSPAWGKDHVADDLDLLQRIYSDTIGNS